jgi:hypothetical protein
VAEEVDFSFSRGPKFSLSRGKMLFIHLTSVLRSSRAIVTDPNYWCTYNVYVRSLGHKLGATAKFVAHTSCFVACFCVQPTTVFVCCTHVEPWLYGFCRTSIKSQQPSCDIY